MSAHPDPQLLTIITRLNQCLKRPGGIERDRAIARARSGVEGLRQRFRSVLDQEVESMVLLVPGDLQDVAAQTLDDLALRAGVVFNLAGTYGFGGLQAAAASLIDLIVLMHRDSVFAAAPLLVHVMACKLLAPSAPALSREEGSQLVAQLGRVVARFAA